MGALRISRGEDSAAGPLPEPAALLRCPCYLIRIWHGLGFFVRDIDVGVLKGCGAGTAFNWGRCFAD